MGSLLVVTGPPGSGKSTIAPAVADLREPSALVTGDVFFGFVHRGAITPWLPEARTQNETWTKAAAAAAGRFARDWFTVYDGLVPPAFMATFAEAAGVPVHYAVLMPPLELCLHRVAIREGHGFDDAPTATWLYDEFARASIAPRNLVSDPAGAPTDVAAEIVARFDDGTLALP